MPDLTHDEIVEAMADAFDRAAVIHVEYGEPHYVENTEEALAAALSALRDIAKRRGYRLMAPVEATGAMTWRGWNAIDWQRPEYPDAYEWDKRADPHQTSMKEDVEDAWRSMLAAAPDPTTPEPKP